MNKLLLIVVALAMVGGMAHAVQAPDAINYQGVLRNASDNPLDGTYSMVFRLHSAASGGDEIVVDTHGIVTVSNGLFSVTIGGSSAGGTGVITDGSGPGNYVYIPLVFAHYEDVYLEVEVDGEILSPRTRIVSVPSALNSRFVNGIEVAAPGPLDIYVNAVTGDDVNNSGLWSGSPKQTIQAAVDRVPAILTGPVTIHIADGTYPEEVYIPNQVMKGGHSIVLVGNEAAPQNVVLDGEGIRDTGIMTFGIGEVRGMEVTNFQEVGIEVALGALDVANCRVTGNGQVGISLHHATAEIRNTVVENNAGIGVAAAAGGSTAYINGSQINGNGSHGLLVDAGSQAYAEGSVVIQGNGGIGAVVRDGSCIDFQGRADVTIQSNTGGDMVAAYHSTIRSYGSGTTGGCVEADTQSMCDP